MSFAVCVPTCGRVESLKACIDSIATQIRANSDFEVILIDNNFDKSFSDRVQAVCESYAEIVRYAREERPGLSSARHAALEQSDANIICYVDDDVIFTPDWFGSIREAFSTPDVAISGGPTIPRFEGSVPSWFWDFMYPTPYGGWSNGWLSLLDIGRDIDDIHPNWIWGLNFAIRRDVLLDCGGFHVDLVPRKFMRWQGDGETGLTIKLAEKGYRAVYRQASLLYHQCGQDRLTPEYFERRAYYQGVCNAYTALRQEYRGEVSSLPERDFSNFRARILTPLRKAKTLLRSIAGQRVSQNRWESDAASVRVRCRKAEQDGRLFLQREAANDPDLQKWIARDTYFDIDLRKLLHE
jgi:glycosyltransferase involved in cell wall biosynthesis